jgi:hypothetical protein
MSNNNDFIMKDSTFNTTNLESSIKHNKTKKNVSNSNNNNNSSSNNSKTFTKLVVDEDIFINQCLQTQCNKCATTEWHYNWKTYGQGISPSLELQCKKCNHKHVISTSKKWYPPLNISKHNSKLNYNTAILFIAVLMCGLTLSPVCTFGCIMWH